VAYELSSVVRLGPAAGFREVWPAAGGFDRIILYKTLSEYTYFSEGEHLDKATTRGDFWEGETTFG